MCVNLKTDVDFEKKSPLFPLLFGTFPDMNTRLEKYESMRESRVVEEETRVCNILSLKKLYVYMCTKSIAKQQTGGGFCVAPSRFQSLKDSFARESQLHEICDDSFGEGASSSSTSSSS